MGKAKAAEAIIEEIGLASDSLGTILKGFGFDQRSRRFLLPPTIETDSGGAVHASLSKLVNYIGRLPSKRLSAYHTYYLFLFGTGYVAMGMEEPGIGDTLLFNIPKLPEGQPDAFLTSLPKKEHLASGPPVTDIFYLEGPLRTDIDSLQRGLLSEPWNCRILSNNGESGHSI